MLFESQRDRARHKRDGSKMLAQTVVQILADAALFAVTDGEYLAFQSARTIFQKSLGFFLVADVDNNRNRRLGFAFGAAQCRRTNTHPQSGAIFAKITIFQLIRVAFRDDVAKDE